MINNLKVYEYDKKKKFSLKQVVAAVTLGTMVIGFTGCGDKQKNNDTKEDISLSVEESIFEDELIFELNIDTVKNNLKAIFPNINDDILNNAALMLSLDLFTERDENGKLNADKIARYKGKIDANNMMNDFNSFLDILQQYIIKNETIYEVSYTLSESQKTDKEILSKLESILNSMINYRTKKKDKELADAFKTIYRMFIKDDEIEVNGVNYTISDLTLTARAVANTYAEAAAYYAKDVISEKDYEKIDEALDDQNNKGQIREILAIFGNELPEESEQKDLISKFDALYNKATEIISPKIKTSNQTIKDLVNYLNMDYLNSDKVSTKDKNQLFDGYSDDRLEKVIELVQAITEYSLKNPEDTIIYSELLLPEYTETKTGAADVIALNYTQFNSFMTIDTKSKIKDLNSFRNNPYSNNLFLYFTKQDFVHLDKSEKEHNVGFQEISDGTNLVNYTTMLQIINKLNKVKNIDNYQEKLEIDLVEAMKQVQVVVTGECKKGTEDLLFMFDTGNELVITK